MKTIKIFLASSSELSKEREEFVSLLNTINKLYPNLKLESIKWETDIPSGSYDKKRIQDEINPLLDDSDVLILIVYSKLGKFTLEEYELAKAENKKIFIYFKTGFSPRNKEEIANYNKVIEFRDYIVKENQLLFEEFNNIDQFRNIVKDDLTLYFSKLEPERTNGFTKPSKHLTPIPAYNQENLIGRKGLLEKIHQKLTKNREVVLVNGVGGIGKTTLAYAYVNDETYTKHYNHIAWITVMDNIKDDLTNQLSNDDTGFTYNPNEDVDGNLQSLSDVMRHFDGDNLLIIDNANDSEDILNNKKSIETFGWRVLFTSRSKPAGTTIIHVEELEPVDAKVLFCRFYKREIDDEILTKLLAHIEYHTLLTELLAKAANKNRRLDIAALYDMVESEGIKAPRLGGKIPIGKHAGQRDIEKEQKLYNYILAIFDLSDLSEDEKEYLRYFSVLPSTTIEANDLVGFFKIKEDNEIAFYDVLDELVKKGWLQEIENSYKVHPLIQTVCREKLKPNAKNCSILIDTFTWKLHTEMGDNFLDRKVFIPYAESILSVIDEDGLVLAALAGNLTGILEALGIYGKALEFELKALTIREKVLDKNHPHLATSYNNVSVIYISLGDLKKALEYGLKALAIYEKVLDKDHPDLATSYDNISQTYLNLKDLNKALEYGLKALVIREKVLDKVHPGLAFSYSNTSLIYQDLEDLEKALEYGLKALAINEKVLDKDHPNLATSFFCIASTYYYLKDYQQAKGYIDKAVDIYQRILPAEHSNLKKALAWQESIHVKYDAD
jgi:tetratricopeptide (TPR) repeat protein